MIILFGKITIEAIDFGDDEDESEEKYDTDSDSEDTEEWTE